MSTPKYRIANNVTVKNYKLIQEFFFGQLKYNNIISGFDQCHDFFKW